MCNLQCITGHNKNILIRENLNKTMYLLAVITCFYNNAWRR